MKKILILPAWYPNSEKFAGSFFQEQAWFLSQNEFEIKVLMAEELHTKSYLFQRFKRIFKGQFQLLSKHFLLQDPEAFSFPVILQKSWTEAKKVRVLENAYLKAYKRFTIVKWQPDLIHVQGTYKAGFAAEKIHDAFGIPYVTIEHSPFILKAHSVFIRNKIISSISKASRVGAVSNFQKSRLVNDGVVDQVEVAWNLMDEEQFKFPTNERTKDDNFVITTITTPAKVKDVETFFKAVSEFRRSLVGDRNLEVYVVGNNAQIDTGLNTKYFENLAMHYEIEDVCNFIPLLDRAEIVLLLQKTDVFISTSIYESFGIAIREAMLCGVPVIATRSGGPEDTVNELTGALVDKGDSDAIAKYLLAIINKELVFDSLYIREFVIKQTGRAAFLRRMENFYTLNV